MKFIDHFLFRIKIKSVVKKGGDMNSVTFKGNSSTITP